MNEKPILRRAVRRTEHPLEGDGILSIQKALTGLKFPAKKDQLIRNAGDRVIQFEDCVVVLLKEVLQSIDQVEFKSLDDATQKIHEVMAKGSGTKAA